MDRFRLGSAVKGFHSILTLSQTYHVPQQCFGVKIQLMQTFSKSMTFASRSSSVEVLYNSVNLIRRILFVHLSRRVLPLIYTQQDFHLRLDVHGGFQWHVPSLVNLNIFKVERDFHFFESPRFPDTNRVQYFFLNNSPNLPISMCFRLFIFVPIFCLTRYGGLQNMCKLNLICQLPVHM